MGRCNCLVGPWGWNTGHSSIGGEAGHCSDDYRRGERMADLRMRYRVGCPFQIRGRLEDGLVR